MRRFLLSLLAAFGLAATAAPPASAETVLRAVMHSDLKIIDPIWTTALISAHHGYLVYDTLFSLDEHLQVKPQMVDTWTVSPDKLTYVFTLRDGLEWHDGKPVTGEDCVASIRRWGARDSTGQTLMSFIAEMSAPDARTIKIVLREPFGLVIDMLGKTGGNVAFMMPKRIAETDPLKQITDATGSGPFIFKKDEWKAGEKAVYVKNPRYKPRNEAPSGFAGGKVAKVDRIEWIWISDTQTQVNALLNGEVDVIETLPYDLLPLVEKDKNVKTQVIDKAGRQYVMRFNTLLKPFDNAKVRQAVVYAMRQKPFLDANIGDPRFYQECKSIFPCGLSLESSRGWDDKLNGDAAKARQMLQEAGYDGTPIVMLHQTDLVNHSNLAPVAKPMLEAAGFKVNMQSMDWQTLVARRTKKDPADKGGWHIFFTSSGALSIADPPSHFFINAACEKSMFGWPCDAEIEKLKDAFARETDDGRRKEIAQKLQYRLMEYPTYVQLGQFTQPTAMRSNISGFNPAPAITFWNVEKK
ncbi:MAG TPA: ABC transporter substrate-binding protein [Reyranella sp.]|jgi:peptide/nickel transport system substrate-binding protein|nr:ABC transporter substrate-binding protein [Reyranella sp.]